jgi:phenylalanyl-tRNA synthetase beta chain
MKFSENWLRTFVNPALSSAELAHQLTMAGLEVEALEPVAPNFERVVVGEVLALDKHPDADRLQVCRVDIGTESPLQIVCGARNVHVGARVPCALVGAQLPGISIKQAKVRGVESSGMLCSARELGLAEEADGLLLLPSDAPVGADIRAYLDLDDALFTLKLTPNRSDCLSLAGVAREVSAVTATSMVMPKIATVGASISDALAVVVAEPAACPRYCGRIVRGINAAAATPVWMVRRLERSGLRSISAVVDVTNYVMLELGQPLHAFDLQKLAGGITVRFARPQEQLKLLNGQTATLDAGILVIADNGKALAVAGIMGGLDSAVSDGTTDIFLESAFFSPDVIMGRARRLGVGSDSCYRFERGVDFAATREAMERASALILEICGGAAGPISEVCGELPRREPIPLRVARACRVLGIELDAAQVEALLRRLQLSFAWSEDCCFVIPPSYRFDLNIEVDLIEELARLYGYDNIPATPPRAELAMLAQPDAVRGTAQLKAAIAARDYQEIISYSFVNEAWERDFAGNDHPLALQNPIASHMSVMRSTLFGGLVEALRYNLNRRQERVRLFEVGCCFLAGSGGGVGAQPMRVAGLCYGAAKPEQWGEAARPVDFFDVKADVEALCWPRLPRFSATPHPALHPGQSAQIWLDEQPVGWIGALHPQWQQQYDLPASPVLFEMDLAALLERPVPVYAEVSKFPPVRRDIAVVVDDGSAVQALLDGLRETLPRAVTGVELFDVYRGQGIDPGKKSLAFRVLMQDTQKTLTDAEVDDAIAQLTQILVTRFNAKLRT